IKIGITGNAERRFRELSRETPFEFSTVAQLDGNGNDILDLEKVFHQNFESSGFSGFDGATEWLKFNPDILAIMRILGA
ncbi:GIY-YIG nuclease family protein, partial [Klebsiella pneumoniae]